MKYLRVPDDIEIMVNGQRWMDSSGNIDPPWSFSRYLENIVLADPAIGTTYKDLKACSIVENQFKDATVDTWMGVEDAHWERLKSVIENPKGGGIPSSVLRQFLPFMDAILEAKSKKPDDIKNANSKSKSSREQK